MPLQGSQSQGSGGGVARGQPQPRSVLHRAPPAQQVQQAQPVQPAKQEDQGQLGEQEELEDLYRGNTAGPANPGT